MIEIEEVSKSFENKKILDDINLSIQKGSIFGLIGANGAGKTTLLRCITGVYRTDSGIIRVKGEPIYDNLLAKSTMAYVQDENDFFLSYTPQELIKFYSLAYKGFDINRFHDLNKAMELPMKERIIKFSKGMKMRLSITLALAQRPEILIMDEPTSGLDPIIKRVVLNAIIDEAAEKNTTIIISSHNIGELERICDSVAILHKGKVKYSNTVENMKKTMGKLQVVMKDSINLEDKKELNIAGMTKTGKMYTLVCRDIKDTKERLKDFGVIYMEEIDLSLEDMFLYEVGGENTYEKIFK